MKSWRSNLVCSCCEKNKKFIKKNNQAYFQLQNKHIPSVNQLPDGNGIDWYQRIRKQTRDNDKNHQVPKLQTEDSKEQKKIPKNKPVALVKKISILANKKKKKMK